MKANKIDYVIFIHRLYDERKPKLGGLDYIIEHLITSGKSVLLVETPLLPRQSREILVSLKTANEEKLVKKITCPINNDYFVWLTGIFCDLYFSIKLKSKNAIVLTSDSLTSIPAIILRGFGYFKFHYFHCTDYSVIRFRNSLVNFIYRTFLELSIKKADLVGCVSRRIKNTVEQYKHKDLIYIPNSPEFNKYEAFRKDPQDRDANALVLTCAGVSKRYKVIETIEVFSRLRKKYKSLKLIVIGSLVLDTNYLAEVKKLIELNNLNHSVSLLGYLDREKNCEIIGASYIGIAFYDANDTYSRYSDPLKIREYAALGIPCVADLVTSAAEEMQTAGAGFAVEKIEDSYQKFEALLDNKSLYNTMSNNSLAWAKKYDKDGIIKKLIDTYFTNGKD